MESITFASLLISSMIPYQLAALTTKSVGKAAGETVWKAKCQSR